MKLPIQAEPVMRNKMGIQREHRNAVAPSSATCLNKCTFTYQTSMVACSASLLIPFAGPAAFAACMAAITAANAACMAKC